MHQYRPLFIASNNDGLSIKLSDNSYNAEKLYKGPETNYYKRCTYTWTCSLINHFLLIKIFLNLDLKNTGNLWFKTYYSNGSSTMTEIKTTVRYSKHNTIWWRHRRTIGFTVQFECLQHIRRNMHVLFRMFY